MKRYEVKEEYFAIEITKEEGELSLSEAKEAMVKFLANNMSAESFEKMMEKGGPAITISKFLDTEELVAGDRVKVKFRFEDGELFQTPIGGYWRKVAEVVSNTAEGILIEDLETFRKYVVKESDILYKVER